MGTHYKGTSLEVAALNAYIKLMRAAESMESRRGPAYAEAGLTVSRFGVLEALHHLGPMQQSELGRKLLKSGGNITLVVDNLEKQELVRRRRGGDDRRCVQVRLTAEGSALIRRIFPRHVASIAEEMGVLSLLEQETLGRLCRRLGLKLHERKRRKREER